MDSQLKRNSIISGIRTVANTIFPIVYFCYASRILMPEGIGKINFAKSVVAYFSLFAMLGIVHYGTRECAKVRDDRIKLSRIAHELLIINTISVFAMTFLLCLFAFFAKKLEDYRVLLLVLGVAIPLNAISMDWLFNALEKYAYIAVRTLLFHAIGMIFLISFVKTPNDLINYTVIQLMATYGSGICNFVYSRKFITYRFMGEYRFGIHVRPIFLIFFMTLFIQVFTHMDSTMLSLIVDDYATGLYTAANRINGSVATVIQSLVLVFMPQISFYAKNKNKEKICQLSEMAINIILMLGIPAMIGCFLLSKSIITLLSGPAFEAATTTSQVLSMRIVLVPLNSFIVLYLFIPISKEKWNLISTGIAAVLNFTMNMILIPIIHESGAAISTVAAEMIELAVNLFLLSRIIQLRTLFSNILQYMLASLSILVVYVMTSALVTSQWMAMGITMAVSTFTYFGILFGIGNRYATDLIRLIVRKREL